MFEKLNEEFNGSFEYSVDEIDTTDNLQRKKQIIAMVKKLHLAAVDILKLMNHYKKILNAGHVIPDEILKQLSSMVNQLIKTSQNLTTKADNMVVSLDDRIESTKKLILHAEEILNDAKNTTPI